MNLNKAQKICREIDYKYGGHLSPVKWSDVYKGEADMIDDLAKIIIPKNRTAPANTFRGYQYIYYFAAEIQRGHELSGKQMTQCKRLATEIRKAAAIAECYADGR